MGRKRARAKTDEPEALPHFDIGIVHTGDDVMAFDRKICESGCKRFLRDLTDVDFPPAVMANLGSGKYAGHCRGLGSGDTPERLHQGTS